MKTICAVALTLLLSINSLACGATQVLFGIVHIGNRPVSNAIVRVSVQGNIVAEVQTGPFGLYSTVVGPCPEMHLISVTHGRYMFEGVQFVNDGSGEPINVNLEGIYLWR